MAKQGSRIGTGAGALVLFVVGAIVVWQLSAPSQRAGLLPDTAAATPAYTIVPTALPGQATGSLNGFTFSGDGRTMVTFSDAGPAEVRDVATGAIRHSVATPAVDVFDSFTGLGNPADLTGAPKSAALSRDGARLVTASWNDRAAHLHDLAAGTEIALVGHTGNIGSVAFSPDGSRIATGSGDGTARLWDLAGASLATLATTGAAVTTVAFSPDGSRLATLADGDVQLWNAATGAPVAALATTASVQSVAFSPDGTRLVTVEEVAGLTPAMAAGAPDAGNARLWNAATGAFIAVLQPPAGLVDTAAFAPDGATIVVAGIGVSFVSGTTGGAVPSTAAWLLANARQPSPASAVYAPGGALVLVTYERGSAAEPTLFSIDGRAVAVLHPPGLILFDSDVAIAPDGRFVAVRASDGMTLWPMPASPARP